MAFVLSALLAVSSVSIFFLFKIPYVINDLSGRAAKKSISEIRLNNEKKGKRPHKSSPVNEKRGSLTSEIKQKENYTEEIGRDTIDETEVLNECGGTELLENQTQVLEDTSSDVKIELLDEEIYTHTNETIY